MPGTGTAARPAPRAGPRPCFLIAYNGCGRPSCQVWGAISLRGRSPLYGAALIRTGRIIHTILDDHFPSPPPLIATHATGDILGRPRRRQEMHAGTCTQHKRHLAPTVSSCRVRRRCGKAALVSNPPRLRARKWSAQASTACVACATGHRRHGPHPLSSIIHMQRARPE